ncbi:MAG: glutamate--tRNA ligase [Ruminococcaceae bacterium]|nr:glutamate--tRNA ligase [Oscillospiraceae bacterium]
MDNKKLAELLFAHITKSGEDFIIKYPKRNLPEGAKVTRFAPSPTGFLHIGGLFAAFVSERAARKTDGVFFLRIEDTDKKREVENGVTGIVQGLQNFGIRIDEGMLTETESLGDYGPYTQSQRKEIYQTFCKELVEKGYAYPCFCTAEELDEIRKKQEENKLNPGYYGEFAKCRDLTYEEIEEKVKAGMPYVLRLKSPGSPDARIKFCDEIKGEIEMPENIQDIVLLKTDGIPTYHFAHAIDDHIMGTTDVIRGDEWISSAPIHLQLFDILGFEKPRFAHISPIMKEDEETGGKRKLSKRKDPEAAVTYYHEVGYPKEAVLEYLLTIANSNYEEWRMANPDADSDDFDFKLSNMSKAGALFDLMKLNDISKNYISTLTKEDVYERTLDWAEAFCPEFANLLKEKKDYAVRIFGIERGNEKPRKDIAKWQDTVSYTKYFFEVPTQYEWPENLSNADMTEILNTYKDVYSKDETAEEWFPKVRDMAESLGYAKAPKMYKKDPDSFKGHVGDVASVIRVAVTGRKNTPDLYEIINTLGYDEFLARIDKAIELLK